MINNAFSNYENACALAMFNQRHGLKHIPSHQQDKSGQFTWSRAQKTATDVFGKQREISCSFEKPVASWSWLFFIREIDREKKTQELPISFYPYCDSIFFPCQIFEKEILVLFLQMRCEIERLWWCKAWAVYAWFYSDFFKDTSMFCFVFFFITLYIY